MPVAYDGFRRLVGVDGLRQGLGVLRLQTLALVDVEDVVIPQEGDFLLFAGLFVFGFDPLPEDHHMGLLTLLDISACRLNLLERRILAGAAQEHLIEQAVRLAGCVGDAAAGGDPRLLPRNQAGFHFSDNAVGDFLVNIHLSCSFSLDGSKAFVVEWSCSRIL